MPNSFERNLVRIGDGGLVLIIPNFRVTCHSLEAGDVVQVQERQQVETKANTCRETGGEVHSPD